MLPLLLTLSLTIRIFTEEFNESIQRNYWQRNLFYSINCLLLKSGWSESPSLSSCLLLGVCVGGGSSNIPSIYFTQGASYFGENVTVLERNFLFEGTPCKPIFYLKPQPHFPIPLSCSALDLDAIFCLIFCLFCFTICIKLWSDQEQNWCLLYTFGPTTLWLEWGFAPLSLSYLRPFVIATKSVF